MISAPLQYPLQYIWPEVFLWKSIIFSGLPILGALQGVFGVSCSGGGFLRTCSRLWGRTETHHLPTTVSSQPSSWFQYFGVVKSTWPEKCFLPFSMFTIFLLTRSCQGGPSPLPVIRHPSSCQFPERCHSTVMESNVLKSERLFLFNFQVLFPSQFLWRKHIQSIQSPINFTTDFWGEYPCWLNAEQVWKWYFFRFPFWDFFKPPVTTQLSLKQSDLWHQKSISWTFHLQGRSQLNHCHVHLRPTSVGLPNKKAMNNCFDTGFNKTLRTQQHFFPQFLPGKCSTTLLEGTIK